MGITTSEFEATGIGRDAEKSGGPIICEVCGRANDATAIYCENCGNVLNEPE